MTKKQTNNFDISGKVITVEGPQRINDKFSKRTLVLEVFKESFANEVPFDFTNKSMSQLDNLRPGDWVTINYQLRANRKDRDGSVRRYVTLEGISCYKE